MSRFRAVAPLVVASLLLVVLGACTTPTTKKSTPSTSDKLVQMIPDPTDPTTSLFPPGVGVTPLDDSFVEVAFTRGFTFPFYGTTYSSVFINTNGGVTFGAGSTDFYMAADSIPDPGIGVLWSDLDPSAGDPNNADQIDYQQFDNKFVISYNRIPRYSTTEKNTMTLTLYSDGRVAMSYDVQESTREMIAVFDGSGAGYTVSGLLSPPDYTAYSAGTGTIVFDADGTSSTSPTVGQLDGMTLTFTP